MTDLVPGANRPLPDGALTVSLPGPFDLSALVVSGDGKVSGDGDFVFYNQPSAPGVRHRHGAVTVEPRRLRAGAERVVLVASPESRGVPFGRLPSPSVAITGVDGALVARFRARILTVETVVQLVEIYRRDGRWKVRAIGLGYADGLGGLARDFGVSVTDDGDGDGDGDGRKTPPRPGGGRDGARPPAGRSAPGPAGRPDGAHAAASEVLVEVVRLTNAERTRAGLRPLSTDARLAAAAQAHSEHMAAAGFFAHESPDGRQAWDRASSAGYRYAKVAENIAAGQSSPAEVVSGWMNSPGHRRNILDSEVTQIGVGRADGGPYGIYWTQVFGHPRDW